MSEKDTMAGEQSSQDRAKKQGGASWPEPGQEGFVHPDGTLQAETQLQENKRAAADRAAAGSIIHGAPLANPGPDPDAEMAKAVERADKATDTDKETGANVPKPNPAGGTV